MKFDRNTIRSKLNEHIRQDGFDIYSTVPLTVIFNPATIESKDDIIQKEDHLIIPTNLTFVLDTMKVNFSLKTKTKLYFGKSNDTPDLSQPVIFNYLTSEKVLTLLPETDDLNGVIKRVKGLFYNTGKQLKDIEVVPQLLSEIDAYSKIDMLYMEVLASQMIRDAEDPSLPWRLTQKGKPDIIGLNQVPFLEHELVALSYENLNKAVSTSLVRPEREAADDDNIVIKELTLDF